MFEEEKSYLKAYIEQISESSRKGGKGAYICPLCHSGEGRNRTGAFHISLKPNGSVSLAIEVEISLILSAM